MMAHAAAQGKPGGSKPMRAEHEAMMVVRAELCERLEALRRFSDQRAAPDVAATMVGIRCLAAAYGLTPVVHLAEAMERALARPDAAGTCQNALYLDRLRDAIGCERLDDEAGQAMIASVSIRFA
jgi:hypothetical protein